MVMSPVINSTVVVEIEILKEACCMTHAGRFKGAMVQIRNQARLPVWGVNRLILTSFQSSLTLY